MTRLVLEGVFSLLQSAIGAAQVVEAIAQLPAEPDAS
jgi:hypothetical protein